MIQYMITTNDNPFSPFDDFDNWFQFDTQKDHYSFSVLMREAVLQDDMTELEYNAEISRAIEEIIKNDFTDTFMKATKVYPDLEDEDNIQT